MVTFDASWNGSLRIVGDLERPDHCRLEPGDVCYFMGEYTARAGYKHSSTNHIISNLKKSPALRHTNQWPYKGRAIRDAAAAIRANFNPLRLPTVTFVPIPSSKPRTHPEHDDRMTQVARLIGPVVREIIVTTAEREARHLNNDTRNPDELRATLAIDEATIGNAAPTEIVLIDDVLTTGCSFRVCKSMLEERFPGVPVWGVFVARRVLPQENLEALFADFI